MQENRGHDVDHETTTGTEQSRKPTRWPYIYAWEPTVFWGGVLLAHAGILGGILWGVWRLVGVMETVEQVLRNRR